MNKQAYITAKNTFQIANSTKNHYQRIKAAKSNMSFRNRGYSLPIHHVNPMKLFQYQNTNQKLYNKLIQIYQEKPKFKLSPKKSKRKKSEKQQQQKCKSKTLINAFVKQQQNDQIFRRNMELYSKISRVKATLGKWKQRQQQLTNYSKLTRKTQREKSVIKKIQQKNYGDFKKYLLNKNFKRNKKNKSQTLNITKQPNQNIQNQLARKMSYSIDD